MPSKASFWTTIMFSNDNYVHGESRWICLPYAKIFSSRIINTDEETHDLIFTHNAVRPCNFLGIMIGTVRFAAKIWISYLSSKLYVILFNTKIYCSRMFVGGKARIWNNNGKWLNSSVEGYRRRRGSFNPETGKETQWEGYGEYVLLQL